MRDFKPNSRSSSVINFKIYIGIVKIALLFAQRINRIVFLFTNTSFYHMENALTHIKIANLNPYQQQHEQESLGTLRLIGIVKCFTILMQLFNEVKFLRQNNLKNFISSSSSSSEQNEPATNVENTPKKSGDESFCCLLCLDRLNEPTSAMCGHIFCFSCIQAYINSNNARANGGQVTKCPSCRSNIEQNKLIYLHNFWNILMYDDVSE